MAADIGQELYEKIKKSFDEGYASHEHIQNLIKRIKSGKADMIDVSSYSRSLGYVLSNAIRENVNADVLPDGQMYYNIAQKILSPMLHDNHSMVNDIAAQVQKKLDERKGIRIKPQKAEFPEDRLGSVLSAASEQGLDEATMKRRMSAPAETMTQSFADDYMKENAKFRTRAGFKEYIVRKDDGKCCEWCSKLAGRYLYPESTPHDVFRRHDNCGCTVTYEDGEMRQDAWSKRTWQASPEELAERRELEEKLKPVRFSPEEAAAKEREVLEQRAERLTNGGESGIIEERKLIEAESPYKNPKTPLALDHEAQSKHIKGGKRYVEYMQNHEYEPSMLTISEEEAQELINQYHGTGILKQNKNGNLLPSEIIIDNDKIIGYAVNNLNGKTVETTGFKIHYSEKGTHIVPVYENQKQYWKKGREENGHDWLLRQKS